MSAPRVLLVYPPFGALSFPSIGLSLLKSQLVAAGIDCSIRYLNYDFLDRLPGDLVQRLAAFNGVSRRNEYCLGDWMFNGCVFAPDVTAHLDERFRAFVRDHGEDDAFVERCFAVKAHASNFVEWAADAIPWADYDVVGFHSIFSQTLAALALAGAVKARHPQLPTLFGGPSATGDMGIEVLRQFPQFDYVVQGEADRTIVPIVRGILEGADVGAIKGVMRRAPGVDLNGRPLLQVNPIALVDDVDSLPRPDFDDFFARFRNHGYERVIDVFVPIENSRGCWWGAKHHCTFCGLNSNAMAFRRKRADTVYDELVGQAERYNIRSFACVDSILDMSYFDDLLPRLRDRQHGFRIFYEVKANLTRRHVNLLADAGVTLLQPGLEHLATSVLSLMRKGTTFLQNVQFLKWARERDLKVFWSVLFGFPEETFAAYEEMVARMPALYHLFPPKWPVRVRVDRFSPLFMTPQALGLSQVVPNPSYRHVYPFDDSALRGLAYHFEGEYANRDATLNDRILSAIAGPINEWNERFFRGGAVLDYVAGGERLVVRDTRASSLGRYLVIGGLPRRILEACDSHTSRQLLETIGSLASSAEPRALHPFEDFVIDTALDQARRLEIPIVQPEPSHVATAAEAIDWLVAHALLVREGERYLGLACRLTAPERLLDIDRVDSAELRNVAATRGVVLEGVA